MNLKILSLQKEKKKSKFKNMQIQNTQVTNMQVSLWVEEHKES